MTEHCASHSSSCRLGSPSKLGILARTFYFKYTYHGMLSFCMTGGPDTAKAYEKKVRQQMLAFISGP